MTFRVGTLGTTLLGMLALMCTLIGFCLFIFNQLKVDIEETPIISIAFIMITLYLLALAGALKAAIPAVTALGLSLIPFVLFQSRHQITKLLRAICHPGFIIFIIGIPVLYLLARKVIFSNWDEFSHWGLIVKALYYHGGLPQQDSMVTFIAYPPGTALLQYFVTNLMGKQEGIIVFTSVMTVWACAIAFTKSLKWRQLPLVLMSLALVYLAYVHFSSSLWCIYVDGLIGLLFATAFELYYEHNAPSQSNILKTIPLLAMMTLIKESGILLALLFCTLMATDSFYIRKTTGDLSAKSLPNHKKPNWTLFAMAALVPILLDISWALHLSSIGIGHGQSLVQNFIFNAPNSNQGIIPAFANAIVSTPVGSARPEAKFLASAAFLLPLSTAGVLSLMLFTSDRILKRRVLIIALVLMIEVLVYCISLVLLYTFKFNEYEGTRLASYSRYMGTLFLPVVLCIFVIIFKQLTDHGLKKLQDKWIYIACPLVLALYLLVVTPTGSVNLLKRTTAYPVRQMITEQAQFVKGIAEPMDKVYVIWENTNGREYNISKYEFYPMVVSRTAFSIGKPYSSQDIWTKDISEDEWEKMLLDEYKFVYVGKTSEEFVSQYGSLFQNGQVKDNSIYRVSITNGNICLVPMVSR